MYKQQLEVFQHAVLTHRFGLRPWEIARLSDKYIKLVYFHACDEYGNLVPPSKPVSAKDFGNRYSPPASLEEELEIFYELHKALIGRDNRGKGIGNFKEAEERIRSKWADGSRQAAYDAWKEAQDANRRKQ